jgi:hypothetical protein
LLIRHFEEHHFSEWRRRKPSFLAGATTMMTLARETQVRMTRRAYNSLIEMLNSIGADEAVKALGKIDYNAGTLVLDYDSGGDAEFRISLRRAREGEV